MNQVMDKKNRRILSLLAFLIPVSLMLLVYAVAGLYPLGDNTVLVADMNFQYIDYFSYFKSTFFSNDNLIYTFSKNMGGDMVGITAYYLFSPFNLLFLLFPENLLPVGAMIVYLLKLGFCGLTCNLFLMKKYGGRASSLIFSTGYAMMAYTIVYMCSIMYIDAFILLPLIVLGMEGLIERERPSSLYIFSLAAALLTNYYIGFMLCIFSILYFLYGFLLKYEGFGKIREKISVAGTFLFSSLLAGGMSAFLLIPTVYSLRDEKSAVGASIFNVYRNFSFPELFSKYYSNSFDGNISTGLPNLFCGLLLFLLLALYFCNSRVKRRERLFSALFLAVLFFSFYVSSINMVWHGFNEPIGFPYRYSFLATFLTVCLAYRGFLELDGINIKKLSAVFALFLLYTGYLLVTRNYYVGVRQAIFDLLLAAVIFFVLYRMIEKKGGRGLVFVLAAVQFLDLSVNAYTSYIKLEPAQMSAYREALAQLGPVVDKIEEEDGGFYRIEKTIKRTHNDALQFQYNGLTHYSSCEKVYIHEFLGKMGFRNNGNWAFYNFGSTAFADSFLGVKYLVSQFDAIGKPFEKGESVNHCTVFKNPYALGIGMGATPAISDVNMEESDPFLLQNALARAVTGSAQNIMAPASVKSVETVNLSKTEEKGFTRYDKTDSDKEAYILYRIPIESADLLMGYFTAPDTQEAELYVNGDNKGSYFSQYRWDIADLGNHKPGEEISVKLLLKGDSLSIGKEYFYYEQKEELAGFYEKASGSKCNLKKITSSHLKGTAELDQNASRLLFTIPYEKSWKIKLDGKQVKVERVLGALISVEAEPGRHEVELIYIPQGAYIGVIITIISIILYYLFCKSKIFKNRGKKTVKKSLTMEKGGCYNTTCPSKEGRRKSAVRRGIDREERTC